MDNVCKHCGLSIPDGNAMDFCCSGCESAWNMIHSFGLEDYYAKRTGAYAARIGDGVSVIEELFSNNVKDGANGLKTADFYITAVRCAACVWLVENIVRRLNGVCEVRVNYATHRTTVIFDPSKTTLKNILEHIAGAGYPPMPENPAYSDGERKDVFLRFAVGAFFSMQLMLYSVALYAGYFQDMPDTLKSVMQVISLIIATPVALYTGYPFFKNSVRALRGRRLPMDVLVTLGAGSAYFYSVAAIFTGGETYFDTSATILTLITLGRYIELSAKQRAKSGIFSLFSLTPQLARKSDGKGGFAVVPITLIKSGDTLQLLAGDRVPADGTVQSGFACVDESMLTGEPEPKSKQERSKVHAGTICRDGQLIMTAGSVGKDTALSQIIAAVESAGISKTKIINVVDKVTSVFVPIVLTVASTVFIFYFFAGFGVGKSLTRAVAVLVVACPCAMGLAVPLAVTTAFSKAASFGAVVKNGDLFEALTKCSRFCFDKTGTLTEGKPVVESFTTLIEPERFLHLSGGIERYSNHLLAREIAKFSRAEAVTVESFKEVAGQGVVGYIDGTHIAAGRYDFTKKYIRSGSAELTEGLFKAASAGKSAVSAVIDGVFAGFYIMSDRLCDVAVKTVMNLKERYNVTLLSGDNNAAASTAAAQLGGVEYRGELTPVEKRDIVAAFQKNGEYVIMVGDGINDAPALKQADGSIAVGASLTDVALDSADAVLTHPDISLIERLIVLSKRTRRIVRENLMWAFAYNVIAIPFAAVGIMHPIASAISMSASSIIVVLNSTRVR